MVTVLFADLVGYTALAESRDPEAVKNLVDSCFQRLVADVVAFGGVVDKIIGDAIVALFGAPVAHEDDPERAVRTALRMQQTLAEQSGVLGVDLRMRVGINTGEVLVGTLRAGGEYTAMGDVVNTASRLQTIAAPGQVLVGPATHAATGNVVRYESLGLLRAKGRDEPVPAWAALEALGPPGSRPRSMRAPLVGRDAELGLLRHILATTTARRRAGAVLLVGEAGAGKTRLAEELSTTARSEGSFVLEGRCVPYGEVNVWAPLAEALRRAAGVRADDPHGATEAKGRAALAAILDRAEDDPEVERVLHGVSPLLGKPTGPSSSATRAMRAATAGTEAEPVWQVGEEAVGPFSLCVEKLCARRSLLFVIGELHWADDVLLAFLDRLLARVADLPVLLVATARPELLSRWEPTGGRPNRTLLHVDPLDDGAAGALLDHLSGPGIGAGQRAALIDRSGGNPLWLEELAILAATRERADPRPASAADRPAAPHRGVPDPAGEPGPGGDHPFGRAGVPMDNGDPSAPSPLPASLRGMVAARLDLLAAPARDLLEDAAVCGRSGSVAALTAMAEAAGHPPVGTALEDLCAAGLVTLAHGRETWELRSEVVREVAYATMTKAERARRHARVAIWLAGRAGADPRDDELDDLAHHWSATATLATELGTVDGIPPDTVERAVSWVERAAHRAVTQELWLPAAALLDTALRLSPEPAGPGAPSTARRAGILLDRARARVGVHDADGAAADLGQVRDAALASGDQRLLARSLVVAGDLARTTANLTDSERLLGEALGLARSLGDGRTATAALRALGQTRLFAGDEDGAEAAAGDALVGARRLGDRRGEAWALQTLAWIAFTRGDQDLARHRLDESAAAFAEIGDWGGRGWALGLLAWVRLSCGDLAGAESLGRQVLAEAHQAGDAWAQGMTRALIAHTRLWAGFPDEAVEHATAALADIAPLDDPWPAVQALMVLGRARLATGDADGGRTALEETLASAVRLDDERMRRFARSGVAVALALQMGDGEGALAVAPAPEGLRQPQASELRAAVAVAHVQVGRTAEALACVRPLLDPVAPGAPVSLPPSVAPWVALVLTAGGRREEAGAVLDGVDGAPATFLDRAWGAVARAAAANTGKERSARLEEASAVVAGTGDRLAQANVALAAAVLSGRETDAPRPAEPGSAASWSPWAGVGLAPSTGLTDERGWSHLWAAVAA